MARLTITLSDERHRALRETAARRNTSIRQIIKDSLDSYGVKTTESAAALIAAAAERSGLSDDDAMARSRSKRRGPSAGGERLLVIERRRRRSAFARRRLPASRPARYVRTSKRSTNLSGRAAGSNSR